MFFSKQKSSFNKRYIFKGDLLSNISDFKFKYNEALYKIYNQRFITIVKNVKRSTAKIFYLQFLYYAFVNVLGNVCSFIAIDCHVAAWVMINTHVTVTDWTTDILLRYWNLMITW